MLIQFEKFWNYFLTVARNSGLDKEYYDELFDLAEKEYDNYCNHLYPENDKKWIKRFALRMAKDFVVLKSVMFI
ncbi:MAG: hypothetical protein HGB12_02980 [Bacteroidetes bacterium]|nr:hypothetical protein [Bacteroidota bacterium]